MSHEGSKLDPWTTLAQFHLKAEHELEKIDGLVSLSPPPPPPPFTLFLSSYRLPYIIVRPAVIYGKGDLRGVSK